MACSSCRRVSAWAADTLAGLSTDIFFDMMAIRLDPAKAAGQSMVINWHFTDRDEKLALTLKHCTLTHRLGEWSDAPPPRSPRRAPRSMPSCWASSPLPDALVSGALKIEGDPRAVAALFAMFDQPTGLMFDILTPGEGRP